jgi:CDP-diglyceride synthetase
LDAWSSVTGSGPRFRTGDADWAEGDWAEGDLFKDETTGIGSLTEDDDWAAPPPRQARGRGRGRGASRGAERERRPAAGPGRLEGAPMSPYEDHRDDPYGGRGPSQPVDLMPRVVTGVVLAAVALAAFAAGRSVAMLLTTAVVVVAAFELYTAFQRFGYHPATLIGLLGCLAIVPMAFDRGVTLQAFPLVTFLVVVFTFLWYLVEVVHARPTVSIAFTMLPFGWIGVFGAFAALLLSPPGGTGLLGGVIVCAVGSDIAAYFVGQSMGRTPLLARVSPGKTVEGVVGGAIAAVVLGALVGSALHPWADKGAGAGIVLGIIVAIMAPIGDLAASLIKRDLGVKDFGTFLPGHGGILDRFDAVLFCLPAAYYWAFHLFS